MGEALEQLAEQVKLANVTVPGHVRRVDGKTIHVKGYQRKGLLGSLLHKAESNVDDRLKTKAAAARAKRAREEQRTAFLMDRYRSTLDKSKAQRAGELDSAVGRLNRLMEDRGIKAPEAPKNDPFFDPPFIEGGKAVERAGLRNYLFEREGRYQWFDTGRKPLGPTHTTLNQARQEQWDREAEQMMPIWDRMSFVERNSANGKRFVADMNRRGYVWSVEMQKWFKPGTVTKGAGPFPGDDEWGYD